LSGSENLKQKNWHEMNFNSARWTLTDLNALVTGEAEESSTLEFKRSDSLNLDQEKAKSELSKDIASFANSAGGTIVYGIIEDNNCASALDDGIDPRTIDKERLEQVINSRIKPRVLGIHINPVKLNNAQDNVAYVITIPQSSTAHQSADKRYYRRFNFLATAMEDHEIRDVMNRNRFPIIEPEFSNALIKNNSNSDEHEYGLSVTLKNSSSLRANQFKLEIYFPQKLYIEGSSTLVGGKNYSLTDKKYKVIKLSLFKSDEPIFPDDELRISILSYKIDETLFGLVKFDPMFSWKLYADDAPCVVGETSISAIHNF
jgi:hypothetical protein